MKPVDPKDFHQSQRGFFAGVLYNAMIDNPKIVVLTGDLGWGQFDKIRNDFSDRFINTGAAEQCLLDIAVGLALAGKIPVVYTITSFYLRAAETISLYINHEKLNVKLVGGGRDDDYKHDGPSHMGYAAQDFLKSMPNITQYYPQTTDEVVSMLHTLLSESSPSFISMKR